MASLKFKCCLCKIDAGSESNLISHLNGAKHKKKLNSLGLKPNESDATIPITVGKTGGTGKNEITHSVVVKHETNQNKNKQKINLPVEKNVTNKELDEKILRIKEIVKSEKTNFNQMMEELMSELQYPIQTMNAKYNHLCLDLQNVLSKMFKNCVVYPFGSTITGLGFKTSDVDIYVDVNRNNLSRNLREKDAAEFTKISRKCLYQSRLFSKIIAIPNAKTPIVKCVHDPTGVPCDFNFKSMLGVCNSRLIKFFFSSNRNLLGAMIIIKAWGKFHDISGTGKFTNYTLSMMFIFYLQMHHYLPSVFSLQLKNEHAFIQEGWNAGFCNDVNLIPIIDIPMEIHIPELLLGFFKYYSMFDYALNVISPLVGKIIPKSAFSNVEHLPPELVFYKQKLTSLKDKTFKTESSICVQDPFVLNHNITSYILSSRLQEFQTLCENSWKAIESVKNEPCKVFYKIFFTVKKPKASNFEMPSIEMCTFKIPYTTPVIPIPNSTISNLSKEWFYNLHQFLISVLTKVYLFDITAKKENAPKKYMKMEGRTDVHDTDICDTASFHCVGHLNTWEGRKNMSKGYDATNDKKIKHPTTLDREIAISDYLLKVVYNNIKQKPTPLVDFDFNITTKTSPIEAKFIIRNIKSNKMHFRSMANNLGVFIPNLFEKYLKENAKNIVESKKIENLDVKTETANKSSEIIVISDDVSTKANTLLDVIDNINNGSSSETVDLIDTDNDKKDKMDDCYIISDDGSTDNLNSEIKIIEKIDNLLKNEYITESKLGDEEISASISAISTNSNKFLDSIEKINKSET